MDVEMSSPRVKKSPVTAVKKSMGVHAARVIDVINDHADCLEGLIAQVEFLTVKNQEQAKQIDAMLSGIARLQEHVYPKQQSHSAIVGPDGRVMLNGL